MAGTVLVEDDFADLALNAPVAGRMPPITDQGSTYGVDPSSSAAVGDGAGDVKFVGNAAVKLHVLSMNRAIQVNTTCTANESFGIFTRDNQSTPTQRYGYYAGFRPNVSGVGIGLISIAVVAEYNKTYLDGFNSSPWTYSFDGINVMALESIGTTHRVIVNNTVVTTFTDATYSNTTIARRVGFSMNSTGTPNVTRLTRLRVLDSVLTSGSTSYVIVRVS